jgi:hypothetical protein
MCFSILVNSMSAGRFIVSENDLRDRNEWLKANAEAVKPYLKDGRHCIAFVFARATSVDRATTRIGGLPYWPDTLRWPACKRCAEPLGFAAQLDFRHENVRSTVPGDVLTFHYCFSCRPWKDDDNGRSHLTWHTVSPVVSLIDEAVSQPSIEDDEPGPAFGVPVEAIDYPTPPEAYGGSIVEGERYSYLRFTIQGTKIGGYPPHIQRIRPPLDGKRRAMRFLGTIGSLQVKALPPRARKDPACGDLMWGDMGSIYLWLSENARKSKTTWFLACY